MASILSSTWSTATLGLGILSVFSAIVVFVDASFTAQIRSDQRQPLDGIHRLNAGATLSVLRASQAILATMTTTAINQCFELMQWALCNQRGLSYTSFVAMSPTTGPWGMFMLSTASFAQLNLSSRLWVTLRALLALMVWLTSLVLFFNTDITTIYDTSITYDATAGIGAFNGSLVRPYLDRINSGEPNYQYSVLPYDNFAVVYNLVTNPIYTTSVDPVYCRGSYCSSYLLSGGLVMSTPPVPSGSDPAYPLVSIENVPAIQLEFSELFDKSFTEKDCDFFQGPGGQTALFCVAQIQLGSGTWKTGLYLCSNITDTKSCLETTPTPNITAAVGIFEREATMVVARSNFTIITGLDHTLPTSLHQRDLDLPAYRDSLRWLLNFTDTNIPWPSSIFEAFWVSRNQLSRGTYGPLLHNFQSIVAFPFWLFHANNYGNTGLQEGTIVPGLPDNFYTRVAVVRPYTKISFSHSMFVLFIIFEAMAMAFVWGVLLWLWITVRSLPVVLSAYPLFDAAFKTKVDSVATQPKMLKAGSTEMVDLMMGCSAKIKTN